MYKRHREPSNIGYVAVSGDGNVYVGVTTDVRRRGAEHARRELTIVESQEIPQPYRYWEARATRFYDMQAQEEDFDVLNRTNRITGRG